MCVRVCGCVCACVFVHAGGQRLQSVAAPRAHYELRQIKNIQGADLRCWTRPRRLLAHTDPALMNGRRMDGLHRLCGKFLPLPLRGRSSEGETGGRDRGEAEGRRGRDRGETGEILRGDGGEMEAPPGSDLHLG